MPRKGSILDEMFDSRELSRAEQAERVERFKAAWAKSLAATDAGDHEVRKASFEDGSSHYRMIKGAGQKRRVLNWLTSAEGRGAIKAAGAGGGLAAGLERDMEGLRGQLEADLRKDWTPTNPISTGIVPYDLEDLIKQLVPRDTPL